VTVTLPITATVVAAATAATAANALAALPAMVAGHISRLTIEPFTVAARPARAAGRGAALPFLTATSRLGGCR